MSDNFFKNRNGISLGNLASDPANPLNGDFYYNTSLNSFRAYQNGAWRKLGSGGSGSGKNYISDYTASTASGVPNPGNGDFELGGTSGFSLGNVVLTNNIPSGVPTFGTGASGNLSLNTIASAQLAGLYSMGYVSSAASTPGNFVASDPFFIDLEDQAKVLQFRFAYEAFSGATNGNFSGTSSNSFGVAIYDVTNAAWIIPGGVFNFTQNVGVGICTGTFQTTYNSTQYRLVVYNANASSGAITMYFDDFSCGPQVSTQGAAMSDFAPFSGITYPAGMGTVTNIQVYGRIVGDTLELEGYGQCGIASASGVLSIVLPGGYSIDYTKVPTGSGFSVIPGVMMTSATGGAGSIYTGIYRAEAFVDGSTTNTIFFCIRAGGSVLVKEQPNNVIQTNEPFSWTARIPIVGRSSGSISSSDTSTREVTAQYYMSANQTPGANTQINFDTKVIDTHGAVTTGVGSWKFVVPVAGNYDVEASQRNTGGGSANTLVYKNGSSYAQLGTGAANTVINGKITIPCIPGDVLDIRIDTGLTLAGGTGPQITYVSISRISGPATITVTETIAARYTVNAQAVTNGVPINFDTKVFDTHNAVTTGAGVWRFTAPATGIYQAQGFALSVATPTITLELFKNGVLYFLVLGSNNGFQQSNPYTALIQLNAGDYIDFRPGQSWTTQIMPIDIFRLK